MFYITTSRPYSNASLPLHSLIDPLYGDVLNRYRKRITDNKSIFSAGTDEHGLKMMRVSEEKNISPQEYVNQKFEEFQKTYDRFGVKYDIFGRTATYKHYWFCNLVWKKLEQQGYIYKKKYEGLYCSGCEDFYAESQLINGRCPIHQHLEIERVSEDNYFFALTKFQSEIKSYLNNVFVPDSSIIEEMKNIVDDLNDLSISRPANRLPWGVPVESDRDHVMYVWFEALLSYLSCLISDEEWSDHIHSTTDETEENFTLRMWELIKNILPIDIMVMGRDNSKFHLIILPAILMGIGMPTPKSALIHGMLVDSEGRKFSKSLGNGVDTNEIVEKIGVEGLRFFILFYCNSIGDTQFDWKRLIETYNAHLADNIGNLVSRVFTLSKKLNIIEERDQEIDISSNLDVKEILDSLAKNAPDKAFHALLKQFSQINSYLETHKPWSLMKSEETLQSAILIISNAKSMVIELSKLLSLFLPETGATIIEQFESNSQEKSKILFPKIDIDI